VLSNAQLGLISPLALISWPISNHVLVDIALPTSLVSTFGLEEKERVSMVLTIPGSDLHTGVPQGLCGMLLPFPLPRPPP